MIIISEERKQTFDRCYFIDPLTGCWVWTAGKDSGTSGRFYGMFYISLHPRKHHRAAKAAYLIYKGHIPDGQIVRHICRNTLCVNPHHLQLGTTKENIEDKYRDGTMSRTYGNNKYRGYQVLNEDQVREILYSKLTGKELAEKYNVDRSTISRVRTRKNWGWVL